MFRPLLQRSARLAIGCAGAAATYSVAAASPQPAHAAWGFRSNEKSAFHVRYFDARGAMETARLLMVLGGQPFTEDRWALDFAKIGVENMSPGMAAARQEGKLAANLDRAPILVVDGTHDIGQSKSIERFIARRLGLFGSNDVEAARIDSFGEHVRDIRDKYAKARNTEGEEERKRALSGFFRDTLPEMLRLIERVCDGSGSSGAVIGKALSYADVCLYALAYALRQSSNPLTGARVSPAHNECVSFA